MYVQKQPPELFYKKRCTWTIRKIHRKTPAPESPFYWICRLEACNFIKKEALAQVFSLEFCEFSRTHFSLNSSGRLFLYVSGNPDPALGVAQEDCTKDAILGKDAKAWSVYVDSTRSWFQHNNAHLYRSEGGINLYCFTFSRYLRYERISKGDRSI